jgi:hypothetical protein
MTSRAFDLRDEIGKKLSQAKGICWVIRGNPDATRQSATRCGPWMSFLRTRRKRLMSSTNRQGAPRKGCNHEQHDRHHARQRRGSHRSNVG